MNQIRLRIEQPAVPPPPLQEQPQRAPCLLRAKTRAVPCKKTGQGIGQKRGLYPNIFI
jgi:hypothetical protein